MSDLKKSWLYRKLADIFGADQLVIEADGSPASATHLFFPVKEGLETIGSIGIPAALIQGPARQLIETLVQYQQTFMLAGQDGEERLWQLCLQEAPDAWLDQWATFGYGKDVRFGHVYLYVDRLADDEHGAWFPALKTMIENALEQDSVFLPLEARTFVWIIPDYDHLVPELDHLLQGLADTITAEWLTDVLFYMGEAYPMPRDIRAHVRLELDFLKLAKRYLPDRHVVHYEDLIERIILDACSKETLQRLVDKLLGPVKEDHEMLRTVQTFLQHNLNVTETANALYIHRNSMQYRLEKWIEKTGLDVRRFEDAVKVHLALHALGIVPKK